MESGYEIVYYTDRQGTGPVKEFIDGLFDPKEIVRKRIFGYLMLLRDQGYLPFPMGKNVEGVSKMKEIRLHVAGNYYRIFYFVASGGKIVLLHGFVKKSGKTPPGEIETARRRMEDYQSRFC